MISDSISEGAVAATPPTERGNRLAQLLPGTGALYASTIVQAGARFLIGLIIARTLGADGLGIFTLGFLALQILASLAIFGLDVGLYHYLSPAAKRQDTVMLKSMLRAGLVATLTLSIVFAVAYVLFVPFYPLKVTDTATATRALQLFAIGLPLQVTTSILGTFAMSMGNSVVKVVSERLVPALTQVGLMALLLTMGGGMQAMALSFIAGLALGTLTAVLLVWRTVPRTAETLSIRSCLSKLYRYAAPLGLAGVVGYAFMNANLFVLGYFANSFEVGLYAAASRFTLIGLLFLEAFGQMFVPTAASEQNFDFFKSDFQLVTKWIMLTSCPLFVLLAIFAPTWMTVMGSNFAGGGLVLSILAVAQFVSMSTGAIGVTLAVRGHPRIAIVNNTLGWGTSALLTVFLAREYGALGAAFAYLGAIGVFTLLETAECYFLLGFLPYGRTLLRPLVALSALALVGLSVRLSFNWTLLELVPIGALLLGGYVLLVWRVVLQPQDRAAFLEIRKRAAQRLTPNAQV